MSVKVYSQFAVTDVSIGFVLLTHDKPQQAIRLVNRLNSMFDHPPIAQHHNFTQSDLPPQAITENVSLVTPHIRTGWGKFSLVDASIIALDTLYLHSSPDWFVLLSGSDYPIKSANTIVNDLSKSPFDVHIHNEKITYNSYERNWQKLCYDRYCSVKSFQVPFINRRLRPAIRTIINLHNPVFTRRRTPFSKDFSCFAGEFWFTANRAAAEYLIEYHRTKPALANYYRKRDKYSIHPAESYFHTIFCNSHLKISQNHWRYIDWSENGSHPKTLLMEDFTKMCESPAHFARKFDTDVDQGILDAVDAYVSHLS